jgi:RNA polymerase sigma-70 factor (ECF subfamily)
VAKEIAELVEGSQRGDRQDYEALVRLFISQVQFVAYGIIRDTHLADDITQETFIKGWLSLPGLKKTETFSAWLMEIVRNTARDFIKKRKVPTTSLEEVKEIVTLPISRNVTLLERDEHLFEKIRQLPDDYQNILMLRYFEGLSYKEIAGRLYMNVSAVGEKLCRVRQILKAKSVEPKAENICIL